MDMLYARYSNPMDLVKRYINQGRFGTFVHGFLEMETERRKQETEKENDRRLWMAYVHSYIMPKESFDDWKKEVFQNNSSTTAKSGKSDADLNDDGIMAIINAQFAGPKPTE